MEATQQRRTAGWWWIAVVTALAFTACGTQESTESTQTIALAERTMPVPAGVIEGTVDQPNARIELRTYKNGRLTPLMKTTADAEGAFRLEVKQDLAYDFHQLVVNGAHPVVLIMDATYGVRLDLKIPASGYITDAQIEGSPESEMLATYYNKAIPLQLQLQNAMNRKDQSLTASLRKQLQEHAVDWATPRAHLPSAMGALEHLDADLHRPLMVSIMNANQSRMGTNEYYQYLENNVVNKPKPRKVATPPPAAKSNGAGLGPGDAAPDIQMAGTDGELMKLSNLRGKVVLIDFWASWCGPCRRENPHVVNAYRQYGPQGFEVFSVSLDKTRDPWLKAIEQDGLIWPNHVSDLAGWQNEAARLYGVSSIPHTVLIDREGNIIARNLRGRALTAQLAQLFP